MKGIPIHLFHARKITLVKILLLLAVLLMATQPALADSNRPIVIPPDFKPYGKTINQWTAAWWQYVMAFPASTNPLVDPTGANCAAGQSGPVFFLVGTASGSAVRDDCVVPPGKSVLFPIINVIVAVPEDGPTAADIVSLASDYMSHTDLVEATVDGVNLPNLKEDFRFPSPIFSFFGATPGIFAVLYDYPGYYEGYRATAFSDGWWVMLAPLIPGRHTLHFKGHLFAPEFGADFTTEVTYNFLVK